MIWFYAWPWVDFECNLAAFEIYEFLWETYFFKCKSLNSHAGCKAMQLSNQVKIWRSVPLVLHNLCRKNMRISLLMCCTYNQCLNDHPLYFCLYNHFKQLLLSLACSFNAYFQFSTCSRHQSSLNALRWSFENPSTYKMIWRVKTSSSQPLHFVLCAMLYWSLFLAFSFVVHLLFFNKACFFRLFVFFRLINKQYYCSFLFDACLSCREQQCYCQCNLHLFFPLSFF